MIGHCIGKIGNYVLVLLSIVFLATHVHPTAPEHKAPKSLESTKLFYVPLSHERHHDTVNARTSQGSRLML